MYHMYTLCLELTPQRSEEGGTGAEAACVAQEQQLYQGQIQALVSRIYDTTQSREWSSSTGWGTGANNPRKYTLTLMYGSSATTGGVLSDGTYLGTNAGSIATSSGYQIDAVLGGLNLFSNPKYTIGNNALCRVSPAGRPTDARDEVTASDKVTKFATTACSVEFTDNTASNTRRGLDNRDANNWVIKGTRPATSESTRDWRLELKKKNPLAF